VRLASIPHGVTVLMQGPNPGLVPTPGAPDIPALIPFPGLPNNPGRGIQPINLPPGQPLGPVNKPAGVHVVPETDLANDVPGGTGQSNGPFPAGFQALVDDPNSLLRDTIAGQDILGFI
jgi:hypothetical protein